MPAVHSIRTGNFCENSRNTSLDGVLAFLQSKKWNCFNSEPKDPQRSWQVAKQFYPAERLQLPADLT